MKPRQIVVQLDQLRQGEVDGLVGGDGGVFALTDGFEAARGRAAAGGVAEVDQGVAAGLTAMRPFVDERELVAALAGDAGKVDLVAMALVAMPGHDDAVGDHRADGTNRAGKIGGAFCHASQFALCSTRVKGRLLVAQEIGGAAFSNAWSEATDASLIARRAAGQIRQQRQVSGGRTGG